MEGLDEKQMKHDLLSAEFTAGEAKGRWGRVAAPASPWPYMLFWIAPAKRANGPDRFIFRIDCKGYPIQSPTGGPWDLGTNAILAADKWPKGNGRIADVFKHGASLYHPYDRVPMATHPEWKTAHPRLIWTRDNTITDYLYAFHRLLNTSEYHGA
jgi:hypothetical protein